MRVLLIEDDSATAQSIELMLKSENFNVYVTDLGEEGIDLGKLYDKLKADNADRKVTYKATKADWFVVSGETGDTHFYTRYAKGTAADGDDGTRERLSGCGSVPAECEKEEDSRQTTEDRCHAGCSLFNTPARSNSFLNTAGS